MRTRAAALVALLVCAAATPSATATAAVRETPVPILLYHHVATPSKSAPRPALYVPPRLFSRQVTALERAGYSAVTLGDAWRHWEEGTALPERPVILSFDDGYADQYANVAPALRSLGWPGVLNLQVKRLGAYGGLTRRQVRRMLRDGWELAAHSVTHPDLTKVPSARLRSEVAGSREALRKAFPSEPVDFFCYPYGHHDEAVEAAVRDAGFLGATTTRRGAAEPGDGAYALDRMVITGNFSPERLLQQVGATSSRR